MCVERLTLLNTSGEAAYINWNQTTTVTKRITSQNIYRAISVQSREM